MSGILSVRWSTSQGLQLTGCEVGVSLGWNFAPPKTLILLMCENTIEAHARVPFQLRLKKWQRLHGFFCSLARAENSSPVLETGLGFSARAEIHSEILSGDLKIKGPKKKLGATLKPLNFYRPWIILESLSTRLSWSTDGYRSEH